MLLIIAVLSFSLTSCYDFNRDQAEKDAESDGKQILYEAEYSKQAKVEEAKADFESSKLDSETKLIKAEADAKVAIINSKAKAEAIKIISASLSEPYLKYMLIQGLNNGNERIYIPTEASMPILEAK